MLIKLEPTTLKSFANTYCRKKTNCPKKPIGCANGKMIESINRTPIAKRTLSAKSFRFKLPLKFSKYKFKKNKKLSLLLIKMNEFIVYCKFVWSSMCNPLIH